MSPPLSSLLSTLILFQSLSAHDQLHAQNVPFYVDLGQGMECFGQMPLEEYGYMDKAIEWNLEEIYLANPDGWDQSDSNIGPTKKYRFSLCGPLSDAKCGSGADDDTWCLEEATLEDECIRGIANWEESTSTLIEYSALFNNSDILNATRLGLHVSVLDQGQFNITCPNKHSIVNYHILCDEEGQDQVTGFHENITNCLWNITIRSPYGCFDITPVVTIEPTNGPSNQHSLSGGSVFLIIVIVLLLTYLILGCAYNSFYHGRVGMDAVPNKDSWTQCARYTRAGCETSRDTICCSSGSGAYSEL